MQQLGPKDTPFKNWTVIDYIPKKKESTRF